MDIELGPLSILIGWQSFLLSLVIATATHGVKRVIDFFIEGGKAARRQKIFINRIALPATPIVIGSLVAIFVPIHPEALLEYITSHNLTGSKYYIIMAAYGSCLGQFSDYVWHRFSGVLDDVKMRNEQKKLDHKAAQPAPQPPAEPPAAPPAT